MKKYENKIEKSLENTYGTDAKRVTWLIKSGHNTSAIETNCSKETKNAIKEYKKLEVVKNEQWKITNKRVLEQCKSELEEFAKQVEKEFIETSVAQQKNRRKNLQVELDPFMDEIQWKDTLTDKLTEIFRQRSVNITSAKKANVFGEWISKMKPKDGNVGFGAVYGGNDGDISSLKNGFKA